MPVVDKRRQVDLFDDMLRADLSRGQLALADPAADRLGISASAARSLRNGQHRCRILQQWPVLSSRPDYVQPKSVAGVPGGGQSTVAMTTAATAAPLSDITRSWIVFSYVS